MPEPDPRNYITIEERLNDDGNVTMTITIELHSPSPASAEKLPRILTGEDARNRFKRLCAAYLAATGIAKDLADV